MEWKLFASTFRRQPGLVFLLAGNIWTIYPGNSFGFGYDTTQTDNSTPSDVKVTDTNACP